MSRWTGKLQWQLVHVMQLYRMNVHTMQLYRMNVHVMQLYCINIHVIQLYRMNSITHSSTIKEFWTANASTLSPWFQAQSGPGDILVALPVHSWQVNSVNSTTGDSFTNSSTSQK